MRSHLWTRAEDEHIRAIVGTVYAEEDSTPKTAEGSKIRKTQKQIIEFLETKYVFRFNEVMG